MAWIDHRQPDRAGVGHPSHQQIRLPWFLGWLRECGRELVQPLPLIPCQDLPHQRPLHQLLLQRPDRPLVQILQIIGGSLQPEGGEAMPHLTGRLQRHRRGLQRRFLQQHRHPRHGPGAFREPKIQTGPLGQLQGFTLVVEQLKAVRS